MSFSIIAPSGSNLKTLIIMKDNVLNYNDGHSYTKNCLNFALETSLHVNQLSIMSQFECIRLYVPKSFDQEIAPLFSFFLYNNRAHDQLNFYPFIYIHWLRFWIFDIFKSCLFLKILGINSYMVFIKCNKYDPFLKNRHLRVEIPSICENTNN